MSSIRNRAWWAGIGFGLGLMVVTLAAQTIRYNCAICLMGTVRIADGTAMAPALAFQSDTGTGFYHVEGNVVGVSGSIRPSADATYNLGSALKRFNNVYVSGTISGVGVQFGDGTAGAPSITFASETDIGLFKASATAVGFSGSLLAGTDATYNIGAVAATRPANGYFSGKVAAGTFQVGAGAASTSNILLRSSDAAGLFSVRLGDGSDWGDIQGRNLTGVGLQLVPAAVMQPACASGTRGTIWYVPGATGVPDKMQVCGKSSDDNYYWLTLL